MARNTKNRSFKAGKGRRQVATAAKARKAGQDSNGPELLNPAKLKRLYSTMLQCRMIEEKARLLFKEGKLSGNYYPAAGREATEVGATIDLLDEDCIAPWRRDFIVSFIQGSPLKLIFAQHYAQQAGPEQGRPLPSRRRSHAPLNIITSASTMAAQVNIGTGVALACKMQKKPNVVLAFSSDDSTALGSWQEAVNFAVVNKLPIVHVVHDDLWAESAGPKPPTLAKDLDMTAQTHNIPTLTVDGNDAVAVYRVAQEAIRRAREGHGPTLIECKTYRWGNQPEVDPGHSSAKPGSSGGGDDENSTDPISRMETYMKQRGLWSEAWKQRLVNTFSKKLHAAVEFARQSPAAKTGP
jgi:TPP-dependent pyruvate/acetoin dehydrogenase alpha subunit